MTWNLGLPCEVSSCSSVHACLWNTCLSLFQVGHRAIQHGPATSCLGHLDRLQGINTAFPEAIPLDSRSSKSDTLKACECYNVKPPSLNADLCRLLLKKSDISKPLQASIVKGWEAGFDLGSELGNTDHFVPSFTFTPDQEESLRAGLLAEVKLGRMVGPLQAPITDGRWFQNSWVSPYFVIPKKTADERIKK